MPRPKPPTNKGKEFPAEPLTRGEVQALIAAFPNTHAGIRNKAIVGVLYGSGVRIHECLNLYPRDLDMEAGSLRVRRGKGGKYRMIGVDKSARYLVQPWLEIRKEMGFNKQDPIFVVFKGKTRGVKVSRRYFAQELNRAAERADIDKRLHPHGLRHAFAYDLANEKTPIHKIQQQLGHSSLTITQRYINHLNPRDLIDLMDEREEW